MKLYILLGELGVKEQGMTREQFNVTYLGFTDELATVSVD